MGAAILLLAPFVAYSPVGDAGYIWDDNALVTGNRTLRSLQGLWNIWFVPGSTAQYYPGTYLSFWLEYQLWGPNPAASHLTNVLLHSLSALVLWRVLKLIEVPGAWFAAALFALHPVYVESVAWISERKNVLSGFLYLTSAWAFLRYALAVEPCRRLYAVSFLFFVLALFSKTVTCSLPAVLLIAIWWRRGHIPLKTALELLPFFAVGAGLGLFTVWMEKHFVGARGMEWELSWLERSLIAGRALWFYAGKLAWPENLTFIYPRWSIDTRDGLQYLYPAGVIAPVATLWLARNRIGRGPIAAVLIFCGTLVPALGFFDVYPMRYSFVADHFQYLASIALLVLFAAGFARVCRIMGTAGAITNAAAAGVLLSVLGFLTWHQSHAYMDRETLWRDTLRKNPNAWIAYVNLGGVLTEQQRYGEAIKLYKRAARLDPRLAEPLINLGVVYHLQDDQRTALRYLQEARERDPDNPEAHANLGRVLIATGDLEQAKLHLAEALALRPNDADVHNQMGILSRQRKQLAEAEAHFEKAARLRAGNAEALNNLATVMEARGETGQAVQYYRAAIEAKPEQVSAHVNLGRVLARNGRVDEAIAHLRTAVGLDPENAPAHQHLARALLKKTSVLEARNHFETALRLRPDWAVPLNSLAWMLATHPEVDARGRLEAVGFAERAVRASSQRDASVLDTLAAAYAAAGQFDAAVRVADEALGLAEASGAASLAAEIGERRALYREGQPYHQKVGPAGINPSSVPRKR